MNDIASTLNPSPLPQNPKYPLLEVATLKARINAKKEMIKSLRAELDRLTYDLAMLMEGLYFPSHEDAPFCRGSEGVRGDE